MQTTPTRGILWQLIRLHAKLACITKGGPTTTKQHHPMDFARHTTIDTTVETIAVTRHACTHSFRRRRTSTVLAAVVAEQP